MASFQSALLRPIIKLFVNLYLVNQELEGMRRRADSIKIRAPQDAALTEVQIGPARAFWVDTPGADPQRVLLYLHGGGWVLGLYNTYWDMLSRLGRLAHFRILAIDYRLAPEYPFPAGLQDCVAGYRYLLQQGFDPGKITIAGDSAGGNLTLTTLLSVREAGEPLPAAAACLSPATDLAGHGDSFTTNAEKDALLPRKFADKLVAPYMKGLDPHDPLVSPYYADLRGLPPILIQIGGDEILLSEAVKFGEKARQAGVDCTVHIYPGMWHVWQPMAPFLPEASQALQEIADFFQQHS